MVTIGDVAILAGVSKMTVSRVINNNGYVKNKTRQLVNKAIRELNFYPSMIARSLVTTMTDWFRWLLNKSTIPYVDTYQYNVWRQRTKGFMDCMHKYGLYDGNLYAGNGLEKAAQQCIPKILDTILRDKNRPTAVYCENDIMAIVLLNALQERGLRTPDDLAIVGHDGIPLCRMFHPYITTIAQPWHDLGFQSADMLIRRIENRGTVKKVVLQSELIIGETA